MAGKIPYQCFQNSVYVMIIYVLTTDAEMLSVIHNNLQFTFPDAAECVVIYRKYRSN